ncbi:MAG: uroporphyrinogen-III C-methyltransferase [Chlorobaculum sp.]|nr:uroporphyrinogen-III C-methyltransferase [Chlorobaculum sp.]
MKSAQDNRVFIVGTGPGDPGLLTLRAESAIREADVILYDCGTVEPALSVASERAEILRVDRSKYENGKGCREQTPMIVAIREHYQKGLRVVRLKTGDPTLFGGEVDECDVLGRLGIPYTVIPGISAGAAAASAYALSISRKFESDAVLNIIAASITDDFALIRDSARLLGHGATVVLYMATANLSGILRVFREAGVPDAMPVIAVSKAGWPEEAFALTTLGELAAACTTGLPEPVVYTVGRYVRVRNVPA